MRHLSGWVLGFVFAGLAAIVGTYWTAPRGNTVQVRFDAVIVLGYPAEPDGTPSPEQRERVVEAVKEVQRGRAEHLIVTGGAAHNQWVEAEVEARLAEQMGIAAEDVVVESRSTNTIENARYAWELMRARGWTSAEVVSSGSHLPRAGVIFAGYEAAGLKWRAHAAPWPNEYSWDRIAGLYGGEMAKVVRVRWFGFGKRWWLPG